MYKKVGPINDNIFHVKRLFDGTLFRYFLILNKNLRIPCIFLMESACLAPLYPRVVGGKIFTTLRATIFPFMLTLRYSALFAELESKNGEIRKVV